MRSLTKQAHGIMLLILLSLTGYSAYAQVESPPSLALGVAGVVGQKGSIDVDLLAQIISEKQGELKQEFIKKTFFRGLEDHSYVLWEFSYSTLDVLLESESKDAIKKNLLEKASNLALVYGFSELYLQLSRKMCHSDLDALLRLYDNRYASDTLFLCKNKNIESKEETEKRLRGVAVLDTIKLYQLKDYSHKIGGQDLNFSSFFIDLVFEVLRSNKEVTKTLGFLTAPSPLGEEYYQQHSAYYRVKNDKDLKVAVENLKKRMTGEVKLLLDNFILLKKVVRSELPIEALVGAYETVVKEIKEKNKRKNATTLPDTKTLFDTLAKQTTPVYEDLQKIRNSFVPPSNGSGNTAIAIAESVNDNKELSKSIAENLAAFNNFIAKGTKFDQYDIYYIEKSIMPLLIRLVTEKGFKAEYLDIAREYSDLITYELLNKLNSTLKDPTKSNFPELAKTPLANFSGLLDFITRLDELDKVETYQFVLQTIQSVGEMYNDRKLGVYLKTIVENINTYTILNEEQKTVEVAVEDIITRIYERFGNRQSGIFSLYFSVGINQSLDSEFKYQALVTNGNGATQTNTLRSVGFASEKIGLKVKLFDIKWRRSFSVGETYRSRVTGNPHLVTKFKSNKPLVSDVYMVTYMSGLLYKVANLATSEEFKDPIAGIGIGVAFFNALDLNLGYNWPLGSGNGFFDSMEKQRIITLGFDVKITEYLSALGKKRKTK